MAVRSRAILVTIVKAKIPPCVPRPDALLGENRAYFVGADGSERTFSPSRLRSSQSVYAMSVHKSQGSEFDHVAIVLPELMSPIMTREIIYTAVTRAKESLTIHGRSEILAAAIEKRSERSSGLRAALWGV